MPYNPMTGQFEYGGETYDAPTAGVGMAMEGMGAVGADIPLAFRMMENIPGITAGALFNANRFSNTMFRGGFLDVGADASKRKVARARKFGAYVGDDLEAVGRKGFAFSKFRDPAKMSGKTPFLKPSRVNNLSLRPRIFGRFSSVSALSGMPNQGFYTPFQGTGLLNPAAGRTKLRQRMINRGTISAADDSPLFSGGVLGRMSTMSRTYLLEQKEARLAAKAQARAGTRAGARADRAAQRVGAKLGGLDENLLRLGRQTGAIDRIATGLVDDAMSTIGVSSSKAAGLRASLMNDVAGMSEDAFKAQGRLRSISDTSKGVLTRSITEYFGTMLDPTKFQGTRAFKALENNITRALYYADDATGVAAKRVAARTARTTAKAFLTGTADDIGKFGVKSLLGLSKTAFTAGQRTVGIKLAGAAGTRAFGLALPGLNVVGTASLVYDLTKLAGQAFVSAGNLAKDAVKSMQGSLHKPLFGMGFKDNEVAATSRARGVMAIQNSRLNARSMLGSEASMMAAHFG